MSERLPDDQHAWNALIFILFPILVVACFALLQRWGALQSVWSLSAYEIALISLASFRLTRLIVSDKIFSFVRVAFADTLPDGSSVKPARGYRRAVAELMDCLWCTGIWMGLFATTLYVALPIGRFFVTVIAISALGSFFQLVSRRVGSGQQSHPDAPHSCS